MNKKIAILGSTGSIGKSALKVIANLGPPYEVVALAAHSNIDLLEEQMRAFRPKLVAVFDEKKAAALRQRIAGVEILSGMEGLEAVASFDAADICLSAISGTMGLKPTIAAVRAKKTIALANKEALVSGGKLVMQLVKENGVRILPVDSEHSALFQCLLGNDIAAVRRLILTASGGPFRNMDKEQLARVTVEQALAHPNWAMGPKVTIDSSTLMNKGLEVIEAHWLFGLPCNQIDVVIHPQSIIHSMVEYVDGSMMAQMGVPDMVVPIQFSLTFPERKPGLMKPFDFIRHGTLEFTSPDLDRFRCLHLAFAAIKQGESMPCYLNAANETLVNRFMKKEFSWPEIGTKLEQLMERHATQPVPSFEAILEIDMLARQEAAKI